MSSATPVLDPPQQPDVAPVEQRRRRLPRLPAVLLGLVVLFDVAVPVVLAWQNALEVPTFHLDGAFQTASGLFRLSEGDLPGRDFFPYLGIGPLYLLFPLFTLLGGDLTASVLAAHLAVMVSAQLLFVVLVTLLLRRRSWWVVALAAAVPVVVDVLTEVWPSYTSVEFVCGNCLSLVDYASRPGNSLRPLRAMAPYVLTAVAAMALLGSWRLRTRMIVAGAVAGTFAAIWSNDYGPVSAALMVALVTVVELVRRRRGGIVPVLVLWGSAAVSYAAAGFLATAGSFLPYLRYNLVDVRGDQFWYYGSWDEQFKIYSVGDLARVLFDEQATLGLAVLLAVAFAAFRLRSLPLLLVGYAGAATLAGGLAATIGGHAGAYYFWAFRVWAVVVAVTGAALLARRALRRSNPELVDLWRGSPAARRAVGIGTVVGLLAVGVTALVGAVSQRAELASDRDYVYDAGLGGYLDRDYSRQVALARERGEGAVEEYMGLLGVVQGPNRDLPVDSIIHALGSQRPVFEERMATRPELVVTTAPEKSDSWAAWNISANWWFYRDLFQSYLPEKTSPMTLNWTPAEEAADWEKVPCKVTGYGLEIDAPASGLYEVDLDYRGPGRNAREFSMVRNYITAPGAHGWLALDPGARSQSFPVYVHDESVLPIKDIAPGWGDPLTTLEGCSASAISFPEGAATMAVYEELLLTSNSIGYRATPSDMTFGSWTSGVHEEAAAFALPNTHRNRMALAHAEKVRFADGETRRIEFRMIRSPWLLVFLSGKALDPDEAGYPQPFYLED